MKSLRSIQIEIPVIVGSNGRWYASGYPTKPGDTPDWGFMADSLQDDDGKYPAVEQRFIVTAIVRVPDEAPEVVVGAALAK